MVSVQRVFMSFCLGALSLGVHAANAQGDADPGAPVLQVPLPVMVAAVTGWVAADLGEPLPGEMPAVVFMDREKLHAIRHPSESASPRPTVGDTESASGVQALYLDHNRTIVLPTGWSGATPAQVSILVHEVVHHFQALRGDIHACPTAREKLAYDVQARWLHAHGESLESAFGLDGFDLLVKTNCMF